MKLSSKLQVLAICLLPAYAMAVPALSSQVPAQVFSYGAPEGLIGADLKAAVDALTAGKTQEGKQLLAAFIKNNPNDARGIEIAGMVLLEEKNLKAAALSFRRASDLNPGSTSAKAKLGVTALLMGQTTDGERVLREVIASNPNELLAHRYLAWLAETRGLPMVAITHLEQILRSPNFKQKKLGELHVALARSYLQSGRSGDAVELLSTLIAPGAGPETVPAALLLAQAYATTHRPQDAERVLEGTRMHLKGENASVLIVEAMIDLARHAYPRARQKLEKAIALDPSTEGLARDRMATAYMDENKPAAAAAEYAKMVHKVGRPALPAVITNYLTAQFSAGKGKEAAKQVGIWASEFKDQPLIGLYHVDALVASGDREAALTAVRDMIKKQPDLVPAQISLGNLERSMGRRDAAKQTLRRVTELAPALAEGWVMLAGVSADTADWAQAESTLKSGLERNPGQPMLQAELAQVYEITARSGQAHELYRDLARRHPDDLAILGRAAVSLASNPKYLSEARALAEAAIKGQQKHPIAQDAMGWVLFQQGDTGQALPLLEAARKLDPNNPMLNYHLGMAYLKSGKTAEGKQLLQTAKELGLRPDLVAGIAAN